MRRDPLSGRRFASLVALAAGLAGFAFFQMSTPAVAAATPPSTAPPCSVHWTGGGSTSNWNIAANWSTDAVPGPSSDVCIETGVYTYIFATGHITVHSLRLSGAGGLEIGETIGAPIPTTFDATSFVDNASSIELYESTLESPHVISFDLAGNGPAGSGGTSTVTSPDFTNTGDVSALEGTLTITDVTQLQGGTLSGGQWDAFGNGSVLRLPTGITSLAGGSVGMINEGQVLAGSTSAVAGLQAIGATSILQVAGNSKPLSVSGNLTSAGGLDLGDYYSGGLLALAGSYTAQPGSQTSLGVGSNLKAAQIDLQAGSGFSAGDQTVIGGNVNNAGSFSVGGARVSISGDFTQTAGGSLGAGGGFELAISGHANLAGALDVPIGIEPQQGTQTTALTFASRTGDFTSHTLGVRIVPGTTQINVVTQPQIQATPASAAPGSTDTVSGGDFPYGSTATVYLDQAGGTPLGSMHVGIHGAFTLSVSVPARTLLGAHRIVAVDGTITASAPISVT